MRFQTRDAPQTSKMASTSPAGQISSSQPGLSALDHWNPSAILGRDGSTLVFKDTKTPAPKEHRPGSRFYGLPLAKYEASTDQQPVRL